MKYFVLTILFFILLIFLILINSKKETKEYFTISDCLNCCYSLANRDTKDCKNTCIIKGVPCFCCNQS